MLLVETTHGTCAHCGAARHETLATCRCGTTYCSAMCASNHWGEHATSCPLGRRWGDLSSLFAPPLGEKGVGLAVSLLVGRARQDRGWSVEGIIDPGGIAGYLCIRWSRLRVSVRDGEVTRHYRSIDVLAVGTASCVLRRADAGIVVPTSSTRTTDSVAASAKCACELVAVLALEARAAHRVVCIESTVDRTGDFVAFLVRHGFVPSATDPQRLVAIDREVAPVDVLSG